MGQIMLEGREEFLRISVTDLVLTFRSALRGFIPIADRLRISWRDDNQHVDWEHVAAAVFHACVRSPIDVDERRADGEFRIPEYDIDFDSYVDASWISVRTGSDKEMLAMIRLLTREEPFDMVQAAVVDRVTLQTIGRVEIPVSDANFVFIRRATEIPDEEVAAIVAVA